MVIANLFLVIEIFLFHKVPCICELDDVSIGPVTFTTETAAQY